MKGPVANLLHVESQRHIISPDVLAFDYLNNGDHSIEYKLGFESKYDPEFISSNKYYKRFTKYSFLDDFEEQFYYIPFKYHIDLSLIKDPVLARIHLEYILEKLTKQYPKLKLELNPENEI